jgi:peptidoglycan/xylan/chitin deacetylase (PgdA/CDA1 family)
VLEEEQDVAGAVTTSRVRQPLYEGARWEREAHGAPGPWPRDAAIAVSLTFDVDVDTPLYGESLDAGSAPALAMRLTELSDRQFGAVRGVPRILALLDELELPATFFVPGRTARAYPGPVEAIAQAGHEIGHHGDLHRRNGSLSPDELQAELDGGLDTLEHLLAIRPRGYRSPAWEGTEDTLDLLCERGFAYDSSMMGDDRAYTLRRSVDGQQLLELPVHWSLDDYPYFVFATAGDGTAVMFDAWEAELEAARRERRHVTFAMHPEVIGRGYRMEGLRRFLGTLLERGDAWVAPLAAVAEHVLGSQAHPGAPQEDPPLDQESSAVGTTTEEKRS